MIVRDDAQALHDSIIGPNRKAMPCGCVMYVTNKLNMESILPGYPVTYRVIGFPWVRCVEHTTNCPYINKRLDE